jgi:hypothetical protein
MRKGMGYACALNLLSCRRGAGGGDGVSVGSGRGGVQCA